MKKLILASILLIGITIVFGFKKAPKEMENCDCELQNKVELIVKDYQQDVGIKNHSIKKLTEKEIKNIGIDLCTDLIIADMQGFDKDRFINVVLKGLEVPLNSPNRKEIFMNFMNTNKNLLICPRHKKSSHSYAKSLFKEAIFTGITNLYDDLLLDEDNYTFDFNAYEIVDGEKETVLDFIDKNIDSGKYDVATLDDIRDTLIDLGAKRGRELKD